MGLNNELNKCLKIMDLSINFTSKDLHKKYKKLVLIYHPDRSLLNKEKNTAKFKEITEAYNILNKLELEERKQIKFDKINNNSIKNIENIVNKSINIIKILSNNFLIKKKINVNIDNLIDKDIYVIDYNNEKLYIPMWHHELVFEINNKKIIIECERNINKNIIIDDDNNIFTKVFVNIKDLKNKKYLNVKISKKLELKIDISKLYIRDNQLVIFKNKGIPIINEKNIYFEEQLSDIYVDIILEI